MLIELKIENIGIIEEMRFRPGKGLNVVTGETGAGKSLLLQSLDAVLGSRVVSGIVRSGASRAVVEALFDAGSTDAIRAFLEEKGFPAGDSYLVLRREILPEGKGRASVNGIPATLATLRSLTSRLIEIHGQHENQRLFDPEYHLEFLDIYARTIPIRLQLATLFQRYNEMKNRLKSVTLESDEKERRLDYIRFAIDEIESFEPREGEFEELEHQKALILNSGKLYQDMTVSYSLLRDEEGAILERLSQIESLLGRHTEIYPEMDGQLADLREAMYRLEGIADYLRSEKDELQFSPEQLEDIDDRLVGYRRLHKKYGGTTLTTLRTRDQFLRELSSIEMSEEEAQLLRSDIEVLYGQMRELAEELSVRRRSVIPTLERRLSEELASLGMPGAGLQICVNRELEKQCDAYEMDPKKRYVINEKGLDRVEFQLRANVGESMLPLRKVASGGELSRIMLALKSVIIEEEMPQTMVFDEVDAGVGGEIALTIGQRLQGLSMQGQVIVVTHLHQIACMADHHFRLHKEAKNGRTVTALQKLNGELRLREMARMLGGESAGPSVYEHARELLAMKIA
jgi:DNA repair protein RecN (Recombination protein N)